MTDNRKPLILLDVDGVLNAMPYNYLQLNKQSWTDFKPKKVNGFRITHSQQMADALMSLDAEILWLTTWREQANKFIAPLFGWPDLPVVPDAPDTDPYDFRSWWKSPAAEDVVRAEQRPFIWIDDDLTYADDEELEWLYDAPPHLLISPSTRTGILPSDIERMDEWIANLSLGNDD